MTLIDNLLDTAQQLRLMVSQGVNLTPYETLGLADLAERAAHALADRDQLLEDEPLELAVDLYHEPFGALSAMAPCAAPPRVVHLKRGLAVIDGGKS
jgi:hypothetical protein